MRMNCSNTKKKTTTITDRCTGVKKKSHVNVSDNNENKNLRGGEEAEEEEEEFGLIKLNYSFAFVFS